MILHAPHIILSLRCVVPSVFLMGSSTSYWVVATILKLISLPFGRLRGRRIYQRLDQRLLSTMMGMFGFFFEHWSGVEVSNCYCHNSVHYYYRLLVLFVYNVYCGIGCGLMRTAILEGKLFAKPPQRSCIKCFVLW